MGEVTKIAWTRSTFNPWIGCSKIGPGCDNCYAARMDDLRFSRHLGGGTKEKPISHWGTGAPRYRTANWTAPLRWNKKAAAGDSPWRVFCASLADVFDNEAPQEWREELWALIHKTPYLSWLLVTKRIGNAPKMVDPRWVEHGFPDNVRLLITVCNQEEADRDIPKLLELPCKNGISYEPALGPVDWRVYIPNIPSVPWYGVRGWNDGPFLQWIIVGGESTQDEGARNFNIEWARLTVQQCRDAGVPVFVKQLGSAPIEQGDFVDGIGNPSYVMIHTKDDAGADPGEWPEDLQVQEFPE